MGAVILNAAMLGCVFQRAQSGHRCLEGSGSGSGALNGKGHGHRCLEGQGMGTSGGS